ncbi:MAG: hypothetical protein RTU30_01630 [Candidatus Thorarchaeota archaeon]
MKMERACASVIATLLLLVIIPVAAPLNGIVTTESSRLVQDKFAMSSFYSINTEFNSIYAGINTTRLGDIVRTLSEDYPGRTWENYTKTPSSNLENAWQYVSDMLYNDTGGVLQFQFYTEHQTLVAIKNGTNDHLAPIIIGGSIASSEYPGANSYAASVAAVLEVARVLNSYELTNDVYFVLVNTVSTDFDDAPGQEAMRSLLDMLESEHRAPAAIIWFVQLLYWTHLSNGDSIAVRSNSGFDFDSQDVLTALALFADNGRGWTYAAFLDNQGTMWEHSGGYDGATRGIPTLTLGQYYLDYYSGTPADTWDKSEFHYAVLYEAVGISACITMFLGYEGKGAAPRISGHLTVPSSASLVSGFLVTANSEVNLTCTWSGSSSMTLTVYTPSDTEIFSTTHSSRISINFTANQNGWYYMSWVNNRLAEGYVTFSWYQYFDFDFDGLNAWDEYLLGSDCLSSDSDVDGLTDFEEVTLNTDPTLADTDFDNLTDGIEVLLGTNPLLEDSDNDTLSDYFELGFGTNPLLNDSDHDLLMDNEEIAVGTDPLIVDSDFDGLSDYDEVVVHLTLPMNNDSDTDLMRDGWEVLYSLDPLDNSDAGDDNDFDGLTNLDEFTLGTSPVSNDTDSDLMPDKWEVDFGLDPLDRSDDNDDLDNDGLDNLDEYLAQTLPDNRDTDEDNLNDLFEVVNGLDPHNIDTDGDSLSDGYEVSSGLNPLSNDSDSDGLLDAQDWAPKVHWMNIIPPITLTIFIGSILLWLSNKRRIYKRGAQF